MGNFGFSSMFGEIFTFQRNNSNSSHNALSLKQIDQMQSLMDNLHYHEILVDYPRLAFCHWLRLKWDQDVHRPSPQDRERRYDAG